MESGSMAIASHSHPFQLQGVFRYSFARASRLLSWNGQQKGSHPPKEVENPPKVYHET